MQADYLSSRPAGNAARYRQMADTSRTRCGRSELDNDYLVAIHTIEYRGVSGLGVSRTPWPWSAKPSKTLTADDNNFILMQRLGYESPSRGSRAMHCLCSFAREKFTLPIPHLDHPFGDGGSYRRSEPCLVFGTELGSSPYTIEFRTELSLWCHRQRVRHGAEIVTCAMPRLCIGLDPVARHPPGSKREEVIVCVHNSESPGRSARLSRLYVHHASLVWLMLQEGAVIQPDPSGDMSRGVSSQACPFSTIASVLTALISNQKQVGAVDGP